MSNKIGFLYPLDASGYINTATTFNIGNTTVLSSLTSVGTLTK